MEKAILILLISCFCCVISEFSGIMQWLGWRFRYLSHYEIHGVEFLEKIEGSNPVYKPQSFRPFDCAKCLSFWMCLITFLIMGEGFMALFYACICMVTSIYIVRYAK